MSKENMSLAEVESYFWTIEKKSDVHEHLLFALIDNEPTWTRSTGSALRFARKEDAKAFLSLAAYLSGITDDKVQVQGCAEFEIPNGLIIADHGRESEAA
jgi:hypothetical protein